MIAPSLALLLAGACAAEDAELVPGPEDMTKSGDGKFDSSVEAVFVDMEWDGSMLASSSFNPNQTIQNQLLYTIGHLNADRSVGRLDRLTLTNVQTHSVTGGVEITYHARMPVAWGKKTSVPSSYQFALPHDVTFDGLERFTTAYMTKCVDFSAHEVSSGNMWYYYRPHRSGCTITESDLVRVDAAVTLSSVSTTGKYPEYDKVWADGALKVVAIFGKYEDGATESDDAGISAYNEFVEDVQDELADFGTVTTTPADVPFNPGVAVPDVTFTATLAGGKTVEVVALLVDNVRTPPSWFDPRYAALSTRADLIAYNGHAGLGSNVRALARKGSWTTGQYLMLFMNGCDTYAYVDGFLAQTRASINFDDPTGTKYMDIITNAMPAFFHADAEASMAFIRGLLQFEAPLTYEKMFLQVDRSQVVLVSGEQDNVFVPGGGGGGGGETNWTGLDKSGTVTRNQETRFTTPVLAAGTYLFELGGTSDADLYVRVGQAPTVSLFDCRPYKGGSSELCEVDLSTAAAVHVMVRGWASSSTWTLTAAKQ
jgi:hypothetical protein